MVESKWLELIEYCERHGITPKEAKLMLMLHRKPKSLIQKIYDEKIKEECP